MKKHLVEFDFDEWHCLVEFYSDDDGIEDSIEDAVSSYADGTVESGLDSDDIEYEDVVKDIMDSFDVEWSVLPCRKYWI